MEVLVNDERRQFAGDTRISDLIEREGLSTVPFAIAVNGSFVPKSKHEHTLLREGDRIEIVSPREGG